MDDQRYHLTLYTGARPVMHGWWGSEAIALGQFSTWIGKYGMPGARIVLVDEQEARVLKSWPDTDDRLRD